MKLKLLYYEEQIYYFTDVFQLVPFMKNITDKILNSIE